MTNQPLHFVTWNGDQPTFRCEGDRNSPCHIFPDCECDWPVGTLAEIEWGLWVPSNLKGLASFDGEGWLAIGMAAPIRPELVTAVRPVKVVPVDAVVLEVETKSLLSAWHPRALRHDAALLDDRDMPVTAIRLEVIADAIERARPDEAPELPSDPQVEHVGTEPLPDCEYCTEHGYDHRRVGSKPFGVFMASDRDSDGQPTHLSVSYAAGEHVGEGEAEYVRRALRVYAAQYRPELPSDPSGGVATPGRPVSGGSVDAERRESALAAACESSPWLKPAAVARIMDAAFATLGGAR
jgi:hypothetical protein